MSSKEEILERIEEITGNLIGASSDDYHRMHAERIDLRRQLRILEEGK